MLANFDMDALRSFVVGIDMQSFSRAAAQRGRSQSAISMQLKKLEQQAGKPLLERKGRGLTPTEAGEVLLDYARRILALNDEAATSLGATAMPAAIRIGLPQDFFEDVMPEVLRRFSVLQPGVHIEVHAGRNHALEDEVRTRRLDAAIAFFRHGAGPVNGRPHPLPMRWFADQGFDAPTQKSAMPLVLYDHPCLFRQAAIHALDQAGRPWRLALTTPSLPGVWAAVRSSQGITVRIARRIPEGVKDVTDSLQLPFLPPIDVCLLQADALTPAGSAFYRVLEQVLYEELGGVGSA